MNCENVSFKIKLSYLRVWISIYEIRRTYLKSLPNEIVPETDKISKIFHRKSSKLITGYIRNLEILPRSVSKSRFNRKRYAILKISHCKYSKRVSSYLYTEFESLQIKVAILPKSVGDFENISSNIFKARLWLSIYEIFRCNVKPFQNCDFTENGHDFENVLSRFFKAYFWLFYFRNLEILPQTVAKCDFSGSDTRYRKNLIEHF